MHNAHPDSSFPETEPSTLTDHVSKRLRPLRKRLVRLMTPALPGFLKDTEFRIAQNSQEFKMAAHLVYLEYLNKGYTIPNALRLRISFHQLLTCSTTFLALYKKKYILGTFTLIEDSPAGLPMDHVYREELDGLRNKRKNLVECGRLALNSEILDKPGIPNAAKILVMLYMQKAGYHYLRTCTTVDTVVACFHPRHALFYEAINFQQIGGLKNHDQVRGSPALGYYLNMDFSGDELAMKMKEFFGLSGPRPPLEINPRRLLFNMEDFAAFLQGAEPGHGNQDVHPEGRSVESS